MVLLNQNRWRLSQVINNGFRECRRRTYHRPPNAPKPFVDLKHIRENQQIYEEECEKRGYLTLKDYPKRINELWKKRQELESAFNQLRQQIKDVERSIIRTKPAGRANDLVAHDSCLQSARSLKEAASANRENFDGLEFEIEELALSLPVLMDSTVPIGVEPRERGFINAHLASTISSHPSTDHVSIGQKLNILDFNSSAKSSGWGFYYLHGAAALLEQALVQYAISLASSAPWSFKVCTPPSLVYSHIASAAGYQPRDANGEHQIYDLPSQGKDKPGHSLAGTAEIPFAAMYSDAQMDRSKLPMVIVGPSRCYRAEAGARGVDTKGLYRVHEFTKVEMFGWALPAFKPHTNEAYMLFEKLLQVQIKFLESLGLYCRVLDMPSRDLGASAMRKIDIEAWFPGRVSKGDGEKEGRDGWGEVTSLSICGDYQSRRLNTWIKGQSDPDWKLGDRKSRFKEYPYTVNGTACAVPRTIAALLEMGWDEERQVVKLPECLWGYMGGRKEIGRE
ncbi:Serine--tRNA ligase, mitochondrial [Agyrium rufum]|nr:Serine--tRNA ligase, mitochondrial [Agyrium rufum]